MVSITRVEPGGLGDDALRSKEIVVLYFFSPACDVSSGMRANMLVLAEAYREKIRVFEIDVDRCVEISNKYRVSIVPTVMLFKNGYKVNESICVRTYEDLENSIIEQF